MNCVCKRQWLFRLTLVICSININKYDINCVVNNLMILPIYNEEVDNLDIKYIVNNIIKNGDIKPDNIRRWWESKTDIWIRVTISLIYYRFKIGRIGIPNHNIPSPVLLDTDVFSVNL